MTPTTPSVTPPDTSKTQATPLPDPTPTHIPQLTLWELMRKDIAPEPDDPTSRVLSNPRPSIWDL